MGTEAKDDAKAEETEAEKDDAKAEETEAKDDADEEDDEEDGPVDELMAALMKEYKKKNNEDPTDEVLKKWAEQLKDVTMEQVEAAKKAQEEEQDLTAGDIEELLSIAWECLESSRVIYKKILEDEKTNDEEKKELNALLAKTLLRLGDHSMECGKFDQSIGDYEECLKLRKEIFDVDARELADVYATLAHAYLYSSAEDTDLGSARFKRLKAASAYANAASTLLLVRQKALGTEVSEPPLNDEELKSIKSIRARMENVVTLLAKNSEDDCKDEDAKTNAKELAGLVDDLKEKIDDVFLVLENKEASDAMTKGAEVVEEALEQASSALDKPSSEQNKDETNNGPTNLLQARKKASSPQDIAQEMEEATAEAEKAEAAENTSKQESNAHPQKRKASDLNEPETAAATAKKVKV